MPMKKPVERTTKGQKKSSVMHKLFLHPLERWIEKKAIQRINKKNPRIIKMRGEMWLYEEKINQVLNKIGWEYEEKLLEFGLELDRKNLIPIFVFEKLERNAALFKQWMPQILELGRREAKYRRPPYYFLDILFRNTEKMKKHMSQILELGLEMTDNHFIPENTFHAIEQGSYILGKWLPNSIELARVLNKKGVDPNAFFKIKPILLRDFMEQYYAKMSDKDKTKFIMKIVNSKRNFHEIEIAKIMLSYFKSKKIPKKAGRKENRQRIDRNIETIREHISSRDKKDYTNLYIKRNQVTRNITKESFEAWKKLKGLSVEEILSFEKDKKLPQNQLYVTSKLEGNNMLEYLKTATSDNIYSVLRQTMDLISSVWARGVFHNHLHINNFVVKIEKGKPKVIMIDFNESKTTKLTTFSKLKQKLFQRKHSNYVTSRLGFAVSTLEYIMFFSKSDFQGDSKKLGKRLLELTEKKFERNRKARRN